MSNMVYILCKVYITVYIYSYNIYIYIYVYIYIYFYIVVKESRVLGGFGQSLGPPPPPQPCWRPR